MITISSLRQDWLKNYSSAPDQLRKMEQVNGLVSAFNANIDAVIKVSGSKITNLINEFKLDSSKILKDGERNIQTAEDVFRGLINCFDAGKAEEWLIKDVEVFHWLQKNLGYDKLQMGGQGGIVANVMAVCGVDPVYVHCASLPEEQAGLFLDQENLLSTDEKGQLTKACSIARTEDIPLIHWIIEFDIDDSLTIGDQTITCPKSNRFIATFDPLNFQLHIDQGFIKGVTEKSNNLDYVILSGYQMLSEKNESGVKGSDRIDESIAVFEKWKQKYPGALFHLEMASTQDAVMRKYLLDQLAPKVDSLGFNERELIDLLEVIGENEWAEICDKDTHSVNLFIAMLKIQAYTGCKRLQLHMFGLYVTIQTKDFVITPEQNRNGMQLAATIAAAKAGTGSIDTKDVLLWAQGKEIAATGLIELEALANYLGEEQKEYFMKTGFSEKNELDVIAVPTILIDKPVTLVGMGDTISSISLVAAN